MGIEVAAAFSPSAKCGREEKLLRKNQTNLNKVKMKMWKGIFKSNRAKGTIMFLTLMVVHQVLLAQGGQEGIQKANSEVRSYFQSGVQLMYAVGALVGLIGAVKVFQKWNGGDQDTSKVASAWFGSCIFLVVVATIIKSFFGV